MYKPGCLILFFLSVQWVAAQPLFRITENDKVGYIDNKGNVAIKPVFFDGNDFSEGLAAVRQGGLYGFIDATGSFIITPEYDLATKFEKGLALVYKNGKPYYIDKIGRIALPPVYNNLQFFDESKAIVTTLNGRQGVIDIVSKQLLVDTIFGKISHFKYGVAVVESYIPAARTRKEPRVGVIDSKGKFIVPFGKYLTIGTFYDSVAVVSLRDRNNSIYSTNGVIDIKGNLLFKRPYKVISYIDEFHGGYVAISLTKHSIPESRDQLSNNDYVGFMDLKGQMVLNDTNIRYATDFSNGRAFLKEDASDYILVDRNFKRVGNAAFRDILNDSFQNGYAIVDTRSGFGIIDTTGKFVIEPQYGDIHPAGIVNGYFFFSDDRSTSDNILYGISDMKGNIVSKPVMEQFDKAGFINGLIKAVVDDRFCYIDQQGKIVWQQQEDTSATIKFLNIDYMNRGYFYAYSSETEEGDMSGGWATSPNRPAKIADKKFPEKILSVTIASDETETYADRYFGFALYVTNNTGDTIKFNAQDSRLYMKLQARDHNGDWNDIEYLPSSWCGNSYHIIALDPGSYWHFTIPDYQGAFKTQVRAELKYIDKLNPKKDRIIYSNAIPASINPGQFWNKRKYYPGGIMDPYND
jgi:hypothetical protein